MPGIQWPSTLRERWVIHIMMHHMSHPFAVGRIWLVVSEPHTSSICKGETYCRTIGCCHLLFKWIYLQQQSQQPWNLPGHWSAHEVRTCFNMLCHHGCDNRSDKSCARAKQASRFFTRRSTSTAAIGGDTGHIVHRQHWPWHRGISFFNHSVTARVIWALSHPWSARLIHVAWHSQCCHWIGYLFMSIHSKQPRHQVCQPASTTHIQPVSQLSNQHQQNTCNFNDTQRTSC